MWATAKWLHRAPSVNDSPTALIMACGATWADAQGRATCMTVKDPLLVQVMLLHGADVNANFAEGTTALLCAAENLNKETSQHLLDYGANPNAANKFGETPLKVAEQYHDADLAALLHKGSKHP